MFDPMSGKLVASVPYEGGVIKVKQDRRQRWVTLDNYHVQSAMLLDRPHLPALGYMRTVLSLLLFQPEPESLLLLGLGGCGLVRTFHHYFPELIIDAVENNPHMIEVARDYFNLPTVSTIQHHDQDAQDFVKQCKQEYSTVIVDIYESDRSPQFLYEESFYQQCKDCLKHDGLLIANLLGNNSDDLRELMQAIRIVFDHQTICIPVENAWNTVVIAFKQKMVNTDFIKLIEENKGVKVQYDMNFGVFVEDLFNQSKKNLKKYLGPRFSE